MFFSLQQSVFLHALGSAIGNSLWQLAILWLAFAAIAGLSKLNAANRYRLALAFSMTGFLWFLFSLVSTYITQPTAVEFSNSYAYRNANSSFINEGFGAKTAFIYHSTLLSLNSLSPYISCAYLFVWLLLTTRLVNGFRQVRQFGTQGVAHASNDIKQFVERHAALLQIKKKVNTFTSELVECPLTIGFFKPIILLPIASITHLSTAQVEAILLHELAHIKRHDYLINIFVQIAEISLFFNPFMRLLLKEIKKERENCCDDYVLQFQYKAEDYAKALLGIAQKRTGSLLAMGARNSQFQLLTRVKRMVAPQPQTFNYRQQLSLLLLLTVLGFGFAIVVPEPISKKLAKNEVIKEKLATIKQESKEIEQIKIENPPAKAYDFVKSVQHISQLAQNVDVAGIEKEEKNIEKHSKEIETKTKKITDEATLRAKPMIDDAQQWAKFFFEKMGKEIDNDNLDGSNSNSQIVLIVNKINDANRQFQNKNIALPAPIMAKITIAKQKALERKALYNKDWILLQQTRAKKTMDSLQATFGETMATQQQSFKLVQQNLTAIKNKENWDFNFEEGNMKEVGLAIVQKHFREIFKSIKIKLPHKLPVDDIELSPQVQLENNIIVNTADEDVDNMPVINTHIKNINIYQSNNMGSGKEEKGIIKINSSK